MSYGQIFRKAYFIKLPVTERFAWRWSDEVIFVNAGAGEMSCHTVISIFCCSVSVVNISLHLQTFILPLVVIISAPHRDLISSSSSLSGMIWRNKTNWDGLNPEVSKMLKDTFIYTMVCLTTWFWLAGRYAVKQFNAQVVPSQFNHCSILMRSFNWCTQTLTHHSRTHTHTERGREGRRDRVWDCATHTHNLVIAMFINKIA